MKTTDCLVIGFNDASFEDYVNMVRAMGEGSGAFKDLDLAFIDLDGKPRHSLNVLNYFYAQNKNVPHRPFHNADFLWPVVLYLCSYLDKRGFSFDYINLFQQERDQLREKLLHDDILTIAVTTTLYVAPHPLLEVISFIRKYNTTAKIIVGGPYSSNQFRLLDAAAAQSLWKYLGADIYVTCQEGELTLTHILQALKEQRPLELVDNIAFKQGDTFVVTQSSVENNPLEENMVKYALFPKEQIDQFISTRTAKSCPFACAFCGFPQRAGKYVYTDLATVEKELNAIASIGTVTTLTFLDDTFNVPKGRFKEILRMMIRNQYGFKWNSFYRSDQGDEETIALMREAGCEGVFLGVESGSDTMLKHMNKTARRKDYLKAIKLFKQADISTYASLIIGFPGETYETVAETRDFLEEAQPDFFRGQLWYCDQITPIWQKREEYGITGSAFNWSHNTMDSQTACDLIDYLFLSVEHSIWLPQFGFEDWSLYYLQRKGMSLEQIKTFLRCFNAAVKDKLIHPGKRDVEPTILEMLKLSCQFEQPHQLDLQPIDQLSGTRYRAAEHYWIEEFRGIHPGPNIPILAEPTDASETGWETATYPLDTESLLRLSNTCAVEQPALFTAALGILLAHLNGRDEAVLIAGVPHTPDTEVLPLRLPINWSSSFRTLTQEVQQKMLVSMQHRLYAFHLLTNPYRMALHACECPTFDVSLVYRSAQTPGRSLDEALKFYPLAVKGIGLSIEVISDPDSSHLHFSYKSLFTQEIIEQIKRDLVAILAIAAEDPTILLRDIALEGTADNVDATTARDADEVFHF